MKKRSPLVWLAGLVTLGSGLLNLYSVISRSLPERRALLRQFFPLEFLHLSRFVTLLIGFGLVISSINILKRKQRAFQIVFLLAVFSVVFHLTKGLDYEETILSVVLMGVLYLARERFTVKSSIPDLRGGLLRLAVAILVALGYGVAGFWFLEPREFGIDFTVWDALHRTLHFLTLVGDPEIVPHTRFALRFLDSLYVITITAMVYSLVAVFRPVIYQYRTLPQERERASQVTQQHGRSSLDYFKLLPDKSFFFHPSHQCFLSYRVGRNFALVLADPMGPEEQIEETVRLFRKFCGDMDWGHGFYQTLPDFLPIYTRLGYRKLKIGDDAIVDLPRFSLEGKEMKKFRHRINQLDKLGITARFYEAPLPDEVLRRAREVSEEWLQIPGRRERGFTLGQFETEYVRSTPLFAAEEKDGRMQAFVNLVPSYCKGEATIDLMRHRLEVPNGIMDYVFVKLFLHERERGFQRFSLGMAPMAGFQEHENASREERAVHFFFHQLNFLFSYEGLRQYKAKFATSWEPRYAVYRNPLDLPRLARALTRVAEHKE